MTGEQELLLALLRGELTGTAAELDEKTLREADWDAVLKESQAQAVTLMAADALSPFGKYVTNIGAWTSCAARLMRQILRFCKVRCGWRTRSRRSRW